ncbi:Uncharacterised protein [uncultured Blautia sp.]|nr:Uncharacterised protein [uncultured Blautia sp.]
MPSGKFHVGQVQRKLERQALARGMQYGSYIKTHKLPRNDTNSIIRDVCPVVKQFFHVFAVSGQIFSFPGRRSVQLSSSRRFCQPVMSMPRITLRKPSCSRA